MLMGSVNYASRRNEARFLMRAGQDEERDLPLAKPLR
ncbi:MAG: hypothetical protein RLZZ214_3228 [Verrucomicrobiota bacterium]